MKTPKRFPSSIHLRKSFVPSTKSSANIDLVNITFNGGYLIYFLGGVGHESNGMA